MTNMFNSEMNYMLSPLDNQGVKSALKLFLVVYAGLIAPQLPTYVLNVFKLAPVKILVFFLVIWSSNHDPGVAIMIAVGLFVSLNLLAGRKAFETFAQPAGPNNKDATH